MERTVHWRVTRAPGATHGEARVPGDKSVSHRAVMLGAIARGVTEVSGFLEAEDTRATARAMQALGVGIEADGAGALHINGVGRDGLRGADAPLDLGNSGTSLRLLTGLLAGQSFDSALTGDDSLTRRPMRRIIEPLARMGAEVTATPDGTAPLEVRGGRALTGCDHRLEVASAQVKSCLLLAGLNASGRTRVAEPAPTRDHTERMLTGFGCEVERDINGVSIEGGAELTACPVAVPGDLSAAAFFLVGACIAPGAAGSELRIPGVGVNPTRDGVLRILERMGGRIALEHRRESGGEPVADLVVTPGATLRGVEIDGDLVALGIDELPALLLAAALAEGTTVLCDAGELRVKESDRLAAMEEGLQRVGAHIEARPDGMVVHGAGSDASFRAARIDSRGDHRIAMTFALAALRVPEGAVEIEDCANVATSFPDFAAQARALGLQIEAHPA